MRSECQRLAPLSEEPIPVETGRKRQSLMHRSLWRWLNARCRQTIPCLFHKESKLKLLLAVLGCPLSPIPPPHHPSPCVESQSQYIMKQYEAAVGGGKMREGVKSMYVAGKVRMAMAADDATSLSSSSHTGHFVMWQMSPSMWLLELLVHGVPVVAGSDGTLAWRHTPWLGAHSAKGGSRPLRRSIQGLDPVIIAAIFSRAQYLGEKYVAGEDCFVLKVAAEQAVLAGRNDGTAESIKHVMVGYFSQKSGLLVYLEDSHLSRIQSPAARTIYWETTISSAVSDYRDVDGVMVAHSGHSTVSLSRFGDELKVESVITGMEESWLIEDVVFNVQGLCPYSFIPPEEVRREVSNGGIGRDSPLMNP